MDAIMQLDAVLKIIANWDNNLPQTYENIKIKADEEYPYFKDRDDGDSDYFRNILRKLVDDGYLYSYGEAKKLDEAYYIRFEGEAFNRLGGYRVKSLNEDAARNMVALEKEAQQIEKERQKKVDATMMKIGRRLNCLTLWLALGTGALALIELAKLWLEYFPFCCHCH